MKGKKELISYIVCPIYREDDKRDRMLKDYRGSLEQELHMEREEWFVLGQAGQG